MVHGTILLSADNTSLCRLSDIRKILINQRTKKETNVS